MSDLGFLLKIGKIEFEMNHREKSWSIYDFYEMIRLYSESWIEVFSPKIIFLVQIDIWFLSIIYYLKTFYINFDFF